MIVENSQESRRFIKNLLYLLTHRNYIYLQNRKIRHSRILRLRTLTIILQGLDSTFVVHILHIPMRHYTYRLI